MAPDKIALESFDSAEAEADALLREDDERRKSGDINKLSHAHNRDDDQEQDDLGHELDALDRVLPAPVQATTAVKRIHPAPIIAIWILLSSSVILQNAWILGTRPGDLGFSYPISLTAMHMTYATIGTRVLRYTTHLLDGLDNVEMSRDRSVKRTF